MSQKQFGQICCLDVESDGEVCEAAGISGLLGRSWAYFALILSSPTFEDRFFHGLFPMWTRVGHESVMKRRYFSAPKLVDG